MASNNIYECKICGGNLIPIPGTNIGRCDSCGTTQPIPAVTDDQKVLLYNRANQYRRSHDYKLAITEFETILKDDPNDADVYWNIVLCKHEIEYVQDPNTFQMVPTCNRIVSKSIFDDPDYHKALELSDPTSHFMYEEEAKRIDAIEQKTKEVYEKEKPYDIFICYKEKNPKGGRTEDSVLAEQIYDSLKSDYRVFFSMVSLSDKLGAEYEPFIYHALQTAKVMILVATKEEYVNSVWLENEWSRFLKVIEQNHTKKLIIAYKGMNPSQLPSSLAHIQGQSLDVLGGMQDLIRGVRRIIGKKTDLQSTPGPTSSGILPADSLYKNAQINLQLEEMAAARKCYEEMTKYYPGDWRGWWGMVLVYTDGLKDTEQTDRKTIINAFSNAKKLAPEVQFKELEDQFMEFLKKLCVIEHDKENDDIEKNKKKLTGQIQELEGNIKDEESKINILYNERSTDSKGTRPPTGAQRQIDSLQKKGDMLKTKKVIFLILLAVGIIFTFASSYDGEGDFYVSYMTVVGGIVSVFLLSKWFKAFREMSNNSKEIQNWKVQLSAEIAQLNNWRRSYDERVDKHKKIIEKNRAAIEGINTKMNSLEEYQDRVDQNTDYYYQKDCRDSGLPYRFDEEYVEYRHKVLSSFGIAE